MKEKQGRKLEYQNLNIGRRRTRREERGGFDCRLNQSMINRKREFRTIQTERSIDSLEDGLLNRRLVGLAALATRCPSLQRNLFYFDESLQVNNLRKSVGLWIMGCVCNCVKRGRSVRPLRVWTVRPVVQIRGNPLILLMGRVGEQPKRGDILKICYYYKNSIR